MTGFAPHRVSVQRQYESRLRAIIDTAHARRWSRALSAEPHVAGTPRQRWTATYVDSLTRRWGLASRIDSFLVYLPHPLTLALRRVAPQPQDLTITEPALAQDPATRGQVFPAFNGYSGRGSATGEVVYVNYGLIADYALLDSLGVSVAGKIAVARYGRSFRGIKAREAEYPEGPFRPEFGVQRGSIKNGRGDPSTPTAPSTWDAARVPEDEMIGIARIPVLPIGYGAAAELLRDVRGADLPHQDWQGGLPFRYHVGPGPVLAELTVETERGAAALHAIYNTIAVIPGSTNPDEWVVIGAHRDAWGPGAIDNVSGTASVLEMARAFGQLATEGSRPRRTIVFATWDAEEWGLIGSWEWVEQHAEELSAKVVAYINQDAVASGPSFGASGAGALKSLLRETMAEVPDPFGDHTTLYQHWRDQTPDQAEASVGDLGGGSDFAGFYNLLGIPAANLGFGGSGGVYHSAYDSYTWMRRFGDPEYRAHQGAARSAGTLAARLSNADVLPYDHAGLALQILELVAALQHDLEERGWSLDLERLRSAAQTLGRVAAEFQVARDVALAATGQRRWTNVNRSLLRVDKELTRVEGLADRPWMRNLLFAADRDNGYGNMPLPSIREALRDNDQARVAREIADLAMRLQGAAGVLGAALVSLEAPSGSTLR